MAFRPFLTQFVVKRDDHSGANNIRFKYNQDMDYNDFTHCDEVLKYQNLSTRTFTNIKPERPDKMGNYHYLQSTTLSSMTLESHNVMVDNMLDILLATQTSTRIIGESPDKDR